VAAVVILSGKFGIIGLIYANCLNMGIRAIMSLKISLGDSGLLKIVVSTL
jgi:hypothetical protein